MAVTYAGFDYRKAQLSTPFGLELAMKQCHLTEEEIEKIVGRFKRGPRKGLLKGFVSWMKVVRCGWVTVGPRIEYANGFPCKFKDITFGYGIGLSEWRGPDKMLHGWAWDDQGAFNELWARQEIKLKEIREYKKQKEEEKV